MLSGSREIRGMCTPLTNRDFIDPLGWVSMVLFRLVSIAFDVVSSVMFWFSDVVEGLKDFLLDAFLLRVFFDFFIR